jgi:AcrR family transcriptional regulator
LTHLVQWKAPDIVTEMAQIAAPKRRNAAATRARILAAANAAFTEFGYAQAGLRDIAARADVASSLLIRYFGTKAALFEAVLVGTIADNSVFTTDKERFGETMADLMVTTSGVSITAMLLSALAHPESKAIARRVAARDIIQPLADWLGPPHATARALNLYSLMTGFVVQMEGIGTGIVPARSRAWLSRSLQEIVDDLSG